MTSIESRSAGHRLRVQLATCTLLALVSCTSSGRNLDLPDNAAGDLLARSIEYHDPDAVWGREPTSLIWTSTRPDRTISFVFEIEMLPNGDFSMFGVRDSCALKYQVEGGAMSASVDGEESLSDEVRGKMGLVRDDGLFWRDYLGFLAGLPMCLAEPDVQILLPVREAEIDGQAVVAFDVKFAPGVGEDIYTFYFEQDTARLVGCRFYRDDPATDGETILFDGEASVGGLLLPKTRRWYTNSENEFLGTDELRPTTH